MAVTVSKNFKRSVFVALFCFVFIISVIGNFTFALVKEKTKPVVNSFVATNVKVDVQETFENNIKKNVTVKNNGTGTAYVRITLVSYRVNESGERIGGTAAMSFTPGNGWLRVGATDTYIYSKAVAAGKTPETDLISSITLKNYENVDDDGGRQVIEVIAEGIQANPANAVETAWGVTVTDGVITSAE